MKRFGAVLLTLGVCATTALAQEPRLPGPSPTPDESAALIGRARAQAASGDYRGSAATWRTVEEHEPVIATLARRESVRALINAGDIEPALEGLTVLGSDAPADLTLRAADTCRARGAFDSAAQLYRRARKAAGRSRAADEAALGLAAALEQSGNPREALETYRDLQLTFREARAFDTADTAARRLSAQLPDADPLDEDDYEAIVDRLAGVAAFRRAVEMEREWLASFPDSSHKTEVEASIVQHLYSLRANDEARAQAAQYLKRYSDGAEAHDVAITLFRLDVREGLTADAERRGRAIANGEVEGATLDDRQGAARLLAEYLVSIGQPTKAVAVYDQLYKMTTARRERIDVLWRRAIAALRASNRPRAIRDLNQSLRLRPGSETERAITFWLAHALDAGGSKAEATRHWASLVRRFPFSYYGIRAAARSGIRLPPARLTFPDLDIGEAVRAHPDYRAAALLSRAGLLSDAAIYGRRLNGAFRRDNAVALLAARASEAAGDYTSSSTLMSSYFGEYLQQPASNLPEDFWALAYPRAYWDDVAAAAARHKVDPLLMIGLARQESHFDREARSPVGAIGLFQVMPYTAAELDPAFTDRAALERLIQPAVSAELAAKLLASLQARFANALPPAIASYNADKERVDVWWGAAKGLPEELFIDSIPYQQTRAYVRQVLTNHWMYQRSAR